MTITMDIDTHNGLMYIDIAGESTKVANSERISEDVVLDYDAKHKLVGIELLNIEGLTCLGMIFGRKAPKAKKGGKQ